ncbi:hypothetical protein [Roseivirga sp. UBA838]|uniref:hypothetical protein n=1 Tax=Roseivirga sp. UBA838 TaxID=1947393 RepID=UPI00257B4CB0|nr:hypothetical protein [Roseivirga sp. UBA838]|tara:strand:- start:81325 stop:81714 length:390 start_codon:yes stop_codon:yes gene_type:complete
MSNKQELTARSKELKDAIDEQINTFKDRVEKYGKVGLLIGGGLVAVYLLSKIFDSEDEQEEAEVEPESREVLLVEKVPKPKALVPESKSNFLSDTIKEQAIIFLLGLAAEQLRSFLKNINAKDAEEDFE